MIQIHIDGPYGEAHQDWNKYHVAIMVGAGIGVTPFASILKDIVFKCNHKFALGCQKVILSIYLFHISSIIMNHFSRYILFG